MDKGLMLLAVFAAFCGAGVAWLAWALYNARTGEESEHGFTQTGPSPRELRALQREAERLTREAVER